MIRKKDVLKDYSNVLKRLNNVYYVLILLSYSNRLSFSFKTYLDNIEIVFICFANDEINLFLKSSIIFSILCISLSDKDLLSIWLFIENISTPLYNRLDDNILL